MDQTAVAMDTLKARLLTEVLDIIQKTKEGVLKGLEYAQAQIPDLIKQFLNWELTIGVILITVGVLLVIAGWHLWIWLKKLVKDDPSIDEVSTIMVGIATALANAGGVAFILSNVIKVAHIVVAPKLFLVKWLIANMANLPK